MTTVHHVDGSDVEHGEYMDAQVSLMSLHAEQLLKTGPEQNLLTGQDWKNLDTIKRCGLRNREAYDAMRTHEMVSYLCQNWISHYARIFGPLARVNQTPIEVVQSLVSGFQSRVNEDIGNLRYLWQERTGGALSLQSALEQVRWNGPTVMRLDQSDSVEGSGYPYLTVSALLPYVEQVHNHTELLFDSSHIANSTFIEPLQVSLADAVLHDIRQYA